MVNLGTLLLLGSVGIVYVGMLQAANNAAGLSDLSKTMVGLGIIVIFVPIFWIIIALA